MTFGITLFLTVEFYIGYIPGGAEGYEYNHIVHSGKRIALGGHIGYLDIFKYWKFLFLSHKRIFVDAKVRKKRDFCVPLHHGFSR